MLLIQYLRGWWFMMVDPFDSSFSFGPVVFSPLFLAKWLFLFISFWASVYVVCTTAFHLQLMNYCWKLWMSHKSSLLSQSTAMRFCMFSYHHLSLIVSWDWVKLIQYPISTEVLLWFSNLWEMSIWFKLVLIWNWLYFCFQYWEKNDTLSSHPYLFARNYGI